MTVKEALNYSSGFLNENNIDEADFKALCLACSAGDIKNNEYIFNKNKSVDEKKLDSMLLRLKDGEPLQYVLGKWDFYESEFYVGEGVLIPRPETEELVEICIERADKNKELVIYDLCSGSGCIGISIAKVLKNSTVYCVEKSEKAYYYLKKNAAMASNAVPVLGDIREDIDLPRADIIISNPPYIKTAELPSLQKEVLSEPGMALDGGEDGLDFYRIINNVWSGKLVENGLLFLEIGQDQGERMKYILSEFKDVKILKDIYKNDRMVTAEKA